VRKRVSMTNTKKFILSILLLLSVVGTVTWSETTREQVADAISNIVEVLDETVRN